MPSLDKSRSLVREASLNIFQPSEKKGKPCLVQHADNNAARKRKSATVVNGRRPYYRTRQYRIELIELTWVAKFISRFLLAVTRRGGGQGENIRESLLLLPTELLLLLGQERKGGGKKRGNGEGEWNWPLATRLISDVARLFKGGKRAVCSILRRFIANRSSFYRSFRRISYRPLPVHFPRNFFSSTLHAFSWLRVDSRSILKRILVSSYLQSDERSLFRDRR